MRWKWLREPLTIWLAYTLVGVLLFLPLVARITTHILADDVFIEPGRSDAYNFLWTYWWIQKATVAGHNFYQCDWVLPPTGANLYFHTHVILPTLLTLPLGLLFGPVAGYNSMIILMLSGAASVYCVFLRRTFHLSHASCFITGALFGFSPYFVFKTHAHVNLVGGVFWAGALAVIVYAFNTRRFGWRYGILLAVCLWGSFWTSFVEFFALLVVSVLTVLVFAATEALYFKRFVTLKQAGFFGIAALGSVSLLSLRNAPNARAVEVAPFPNVRIADLLIPARLSVMGGSYKASEFEYWGSHVPILFIVLLAVGLVAIWRRPERTELLPTTILAMLLAAITLNIGDVPLDVLRKLPMGTGFRVAGRFLPFFYFFALIPAVFGLERVFQLEGPWRRRTTLGLLLGLAWLELYPAKLSPARVKSFQVPKSVLQDGAAGAFTLFIPGGAYTNLLDTYQVSMNVPVVHLSYLAREDPRTAAVRVERFPALYPNPKNLSKRALAQLRDANVRYVLFEDRQQYYAGKFRGKTVVEHEGAILVSLEQ